MNPLGAGPAEVVAHGTLAAMSDPVPLLAYSA
jgi:hypothetical protein